MGSWINALDLKTSAPAMTEKPQKRNKLKKVFTFIFDFWSSHYARENEAGDKQGNRPHGFKQLALNTTG